MNPRQALVNYVLDAPPKRFCRLVNFLHAVGRLPYTGHVHEETYVALSFTSPQAFTLYAPDIRRTAGMYTKGAKNRLKFLAASYHVDSVPLEENDVVLDCGANIGELGVYFSLFGPQVRYFAFEPSPREAHCNRMNNPRAVLSELALWNANGSTTFYVESFGANSSVIEPEAFTHRIEVATRTLTDWMTEQDFDTVKLLKIDTEGAEPEMLEGALGCLDRIQYISVAAGPERGPEKKCTAEPVSELLGNNGFDLIKEPDCKTLLFRNRAIG